MSAVPPSSNVCGRRCGKFPSVRRSAIPRSHGVSAPPRQRVRSPLRVPRTISPSPSPATGWSATTAHCRDMPGAWNASAFYSTGRPPKRGDHALQPARTMHDLFDFMAPPAPQKEIIAEGAMLLRGAALPFEQELLPALNEIAATSPFRHMVTPGGYRMSVAMTNCGAAGWVTDRAGYRYDVIDPETGNPWPSMPTCLFDLAVAAATEAGYPKFCPDVC